MNKGRKTNTSCIFKNALNIWKTSCKWRRNTKKKKWNEYNNHPEAGFPNEMQLFSVLALMRIYGLVTIQAYELIWLSDYPSSKDYQTNKHTYRKHPPSYRTKTKKKRKTQWTDCKIAVEPVCIFLTCFWCE